MRLHTYEPAIVTTMPDEKHKQNPRLGRIHCECRQCNNT